MLSVIFIHVRFIFRSIIRRTNLRDRGVLGGSSIWRQQQSRHTSGARIENPYRIFFKSPFPL